ncbi:hypothetical protein CPB85DRAFT_1278525 [Mucidula mucida]|nr:hypothetical protein CPB85DRAFT_1278525 [Mucidula mucida]
MSGKQLSNGTLSLRFMQNAQRKQKLEEVELTKAEVKDAEEWSIPKHIQDSWKQSTESEPVTYEYSYLPFIFSEDTEPKRRRVFKKGVEVTKDIPAEDAPPAEPQSEEPEPKPAVAPVVKPTKLTSLSSVLSPKAKKDKDPSKSARQSLFEPSNVGADLRAPPSAPNGFMKPAGVDDPTEASGDCDILMGARQKKRHNDEGSSKPAPRKKKRKSET